MFNLLQEKMDMYREEVYDEEIFEEIIHESLAFDDEIEDLMEYEDEDVDDLESLEEELAELEGVVTKITRDSNLVATNDLREDEEFEVEGELMSEQLELDFLYSTFL